MDGPTTLALSTATDVAVAAAFGYVGWRLERRDGSPEARRVRLDLALGMGGIAATAVASSLLNIAVLARVEDLPTLNAISILPSACFTLAAAGFAAYLAGLFLGAPRARYPIFAAYGALAIWSLTNAMGATPTSIRVESWRPILGYAEAPGFGALVSAALLVAPIALSSVLYLTLWWTTTATRKRYRILLTSIALMAWSASVVLIAVGVSDVAQATGRAFVLASAGVLLAAYAPPARARAALDRWEADDIARDMARFEREMGLPSSAASVVSVRSSSLVMTRSVSARRTAVR
jgi:hypothetical protein